MKTYDLVRKRLHLRMAASTYLFTVVKDARGVFLISRIVVKTTLVKSVSISKPDPSEFVQSKMTKFFVDQIMSFK